MPSDLESFTENPCKMCLPLGVVTAVYGIEKGMNILHGSQGCSTYIRRHMATHYNEPVDIASSSLTEEGTVFGGEDNLRKGLDNLIKLYRPELVAVSTTCLAETIGEDVPAMISRYRQERPGLETEIVSVSSPGYGGTQFEGYFRALQAVLRGLEPDERPNSYINVIPPPSSPADVGALRELLEDSGLPFILFPDISENLDGVYNPVYHRLPSAGTPVRLIKQAAGARATLELSLFAPENDSPGLYLERAHKVPLLRLPPPAGLRGMDALVRALKDLGASFPPKHRKARGRLLDAMCDAHKHFALARLGAAGDPDFVYSLSALAAENGVPLVMAATGSNCPDFSKIIKPEQEKSLSTLGIKESFLRDGADFSLISRGSRETRVNIFAGSSDARRMCRELGIPLLRLCFPIHDHVGGQRTRLLGYGGSLSVLEGLANELIGLEAESFRDRIKSEFFRKPSLPAGGGECALPAASSPPDPASPHPRAAFPRADRGFAEFPPEGAEKSGSLSLRELYGIAPSGVDPSSLHPCFSLEASHKLGRLHLPVASGCNISCNYCRRDHDCPNESRPGASSGLLTPREARDRFREAREISPALKVLGIAGPGESLFQAEKTLETFELLRREDKDLIFCLSTNGLNLPLHVRELHALGLRHLTVTVNAADPETGSRIYSHADYFGERYQGVQAASLILSNQFAGIAMAKSLGMTVKVNTVLIRGVNVSQSERISRKALSLGADLGNLTAHVPLSGTPFESVAALGLGELRELRWKSAAFLPQMTHCRQCRADAFGLLGEDLSRRLRAGKDPLPKPIRAPGISSAGTRARPLYRIAVASRSAVLVDNHFGNSERFYIYESDGADLRLLENRRVEGGGACGGACLGPEKVKERPEGFIAGLIDLLSDCDGVVAARIGESPRKILEERGIGCLSGYEAVDKAVLGLARMLGRGGGAA
ncbi:MAG: radical SAM protein [Deltaproteobacteria bacterium]|jgi:nitrogenase cofactor biosynthesis protein NifB|nr:radical SAM protein [Deltaproteobacteria bacterium]